MKRNSKVKIIVAPSKKKLAIQFALLPYQSIIKPEKNAPETSPNPKRDIAIATLKF